jgi:N-acetylglucosaminyldiphosphoundecaprenol N-acetyl-beta-D-mannosaminyltransferase
MKQKVMIGGVTFNCLTQIGAEGLVAERVAQRRYSNPLRVFTPNTEQLMQAQDNPAFLEILRATAIRVPDSVGIVMADWWRAFTTGESWLIRERVTGVDLAESLLSEACVRGWRVVLIGGMGNASDVAAGNLKKRFSGLDIRSILVGEVACDDKKMDLIMENENEVIEKINEIRPDLVLVALGAPKQEVWVLKYGEKLAVQAMMVVGGAIDMWSGIQVRAPQWMRQWGLEWWWRLMQQPWRIGRQLRLVRFGWLVVRGKL